MIAPLVAALLTLSVFAYAIPSRGPRSAKAFYVWDADVGPFLTGASYAATMVSTFVFIGLTGLFYTHGVGGWLFVCLPVVAGSSSLLWFGARIRRLQAETPDAFSPFELVGRAYDSPALGGLLFAFSALFVIPLIAMQVVAIGRLFEGMFGINYSVSVALMVVAFVFYTMFAGMEGDVKTDVLQAGAMIFGLAILAWLAGEEFVAAGASLSGPEVGDLMSVPGPLGYFTPKTLISVGVAMAALPLVNGHYIMRFMIARDEAALRGAMISAPLIILAFYGLAAVIGIAGVVAAPGLESGDLLAGTLLQRLSSSLPGEIISGIILFAIGAAALSSIDSQFLALGAGATRDIFQNLLHYQLRDEQVMLVSRAVMVAVGASAVLMAWDPPRLVIQLNILSATGVLVLLPTTVWGVCRPRTLPSWVPFWSVCLGGLLFFWLTLVQDVKTVYGWHPGLVALLASAVVFLVGGLAATTIRTPDLPLEHS